MRFAFIRSDFGVDTSGVPATIVVPVGGSNFVLVYDSGGVKMSTASSRIKIREIVDAKELDREISRIRFIGVGMGSSPVRKLAEFLGGLYSVLTQKNGRLFKITASSGGYAEVTATDTAHNTSQRFNVFMLRKQEFTVDVKFPSALDGNGQKYRLSKMPLSHSASWLEEVNIIFGPQLNIFFKPGSTSEPFINEKIAVVGPSHWDLLKKISNPDPKTITVFLAASILSNDKSEPWGISLNFKSPVIVLKDRTSEDELIKTLAHEFGHTLGNMKGVDIGHPGGQGELMTSISRFDGLRISRALVSILGMQ